MGGGIVDEDGLVARGCEVGDEIGEGQGSLGRRSEGGDGGVDVDGGVVVVVDGLLGGADVDEDQLLGGCSALGQGGELGEEAFAYPASACILLC